MATPSHGYEPTRMTTLAARIVDGAAALRAITSSEPAAADAVAAVRRLQAVLDVGWTPAIRSIRQNPPLAGSVPVFSFGGGGSSGSWDRTADGPEPGTLIFEPFDPLSALFPGDDDITADEIVERIDEILDGEPSPMQRLELSLLGSALDQIAKDEELVAAVLVELGPEGLEDVYTRLFILGHNYPINPTVGTADFDPDHQLGLDLADLILDPFDALVGAGAQHPDGAAIVSEVIERGPDHTYDFDLAAIQGLSGVSTLPLGMQHQLLDVLLVIDHQGIESGPFDTENVLFPGNDDVDDAIQSVVVHIIELTPEDELIEVLPDGSNSDSGVIFELAAILAGTDIHVDDLELLEAVAPYLPELSGGLPHAGASTSPRQYRALIKNLLEDLSPEQVEEALAIIAQSAIDRVTDVVSTGNIAGGNSPGNNLRGLLDDVFGPVVGALEDIHGDSERAADQLAQVLTTIAGLAPSPESKIASTAIGAGVGWVIGEFTEVTDPNDVAVHEAKQHLITSAITQLYEDAALRNEFGRNALDEWTDVTEPRLAGFGFDEAEIARIHRELETQARTGEPVPADVFVKLPDVVELTETLDRELTLSPARTASDG